MPTRRISFPGSTGDSLAARLELPVDGEPVAWALFAHCFTCSKDLKAAVRITRELGARGIAVLRFDFTGLGESEGDFADTTFSSNVDDLARAGTYMEEELGHAPELLIGHSLGGAAVLRVADRLPSVRAVATLGAPADPEHVLHHVEDSMDEIEAKGEACVTIAGRRFTIRKAFLDDLAGSQMEAAVSGLDRALLIMHSPVDRIVGIDNAARLYEMARHPKSFISLDDADHLLMDPDDAAYAATVLAAWAGRYMDPMPAEKDEAELRDQQRVVASIGRDHYRTELSVRRHALVADEPESVGGTDQGPTPYDLVAAGLGACTVMTLRMYADRKEWPLDGARARLRHRKIHKRDEEEGDASDGGDGGSSRLDVIDREIELHGDLDEEQRARLMEIADRCPVHRTLEAAVEVRTTESPPEE